MAKPRRLNSEQRDKIADKLMLLGNVVFSTMIIAPILTEKFGTSDAVIAFAGSITFMTMYLVAVWIMRGGESS